MREKVSLLVVDDSEDDCCLYRRALTSNPDVEYAIEERHDGEAALAAIEERGPDCILLDYSLPGRNGVEVLKRVRASHPYVPVVMLTGQGNETVAVAAIQQGAQNYISKSAVDADQLHRAIQIAIGHCAMEKRLQEQRISLEIFTRALAHDLKEPVRTVKSFLSVLSDTESLTDQGRGYFSYVQSASDRMSALIDAVYDYTRLDGSAPRTTRETCDARAILEDAKSDIAELISERGASITSEPLPAELYANPARLRQVFQNLICNSIHHCPENPRIHVTAEERPDHWVLGVADNGPGIDAEFRQKVFEPFTRMSKSSSKGLGMGLAISKRIVESHGGKIWCEAAATGGAHMLFSLPKAPAEAQTAPSSAQAPVAAPASAEDDLLATILVVDDNEASIELARIMLLQTSKLRCNILSARSGEEALALLRDSEAGAKVDLVLLDINMPRLDGFEVLKEMRADAASADLGVVMCSTSSYDKDMAQARALGASGYVEKPPQLEKLKAILPNLPRVRLRQEAAGFSLLRVA